MHNGYLAFGGNSFDDALTTRLEIINTARALGYIHRWNFLVNAGLIQGDCVNWVHDCEECPSLGRFLNNRITPWNQRRGYCWHDHADMAPWFDGSQDSYRFLGMIGLDVQGVEDSTRVARVRQSIAGGGVVSRSILQPREILIRAIAVAVDEPGLNHGLAWLRNAARGLENPACHGDNLWFLDACPPCADQSDADPCDLPGTAPSNESCFSPYIRHFKNTRIVRGPIVLDYRKMPSGGWLAEIEMIAVAPDHAKYGEPYTLFSGGTRLAVPGTFTDPAPTAATPDPVATRLGIAPPPAPPGVTLPTTWNRSTQTITPPVDPLPPSGDAIYSFTITADEDFSDVRIELVDSTGKVIDGLEVPFLLSGKTVVVDGGARTVTADGNVESGYVRNYDGFPAHIWGEHHIEVDTNGDRKPITMYVDYTGTHDINKLHVTVTALDVGEP